MSKDTHVHDAGKGSVQRPVSDKEKFSANWDAIFGNKDKPTDKPKTESVEHERKDT